MRARVGDLALIELDEPTSKHAMASNCSIGIRGSIRYIAPGNSNLTQI